MCIYLFLIYQSVKIVLRFIDQSSVALVNKSTGCQRTHFCRLSFPFRYLHLIDLKKVLSKLNKQADLNRNDTAITTMSMCLMESVRNTPGMFLARRSSAVSLNIRLTCSYSGVIVSKVNMSAVTTACLDNVLTMSQAMCQRLKH
jgi:hypothetical protein